MVPVAVALGSNLEDPESQVRRAYLRLTDRLSQPQLSPLYESDPKYKLDQPKFINAVATGTSNLSPRALLTWLKLLEQDLGRTPGPRNGPRVIDLDLLSYGALIYAFNWMDGTRLEVPHPRIVERAFVVLPWHQLEPDAQIPGVGSLASLAHNYTGDSSIARLVQTDREVAGVP